MLAVPKRSEKRIPEKEENKVPDEEENREKEERELSEKIERPFNEENAEELFRRLEGELATKLAKKESHHEENGKKAASSDWELIGREAPEQDEQMLEEKDARELRCRLHVQLYMPFSKRAHSEHFQYYRPIRFELDYNFLLQGRVLLVSR